MGIGHGGLGDGGRVGEDETNLLVTYYLFLTPHSQLF